LHLLQGPSTMELTGAGPSAGIDAADQNIGALGARHAGPGSVARDPTASRLPGARTRSERCGGDKALTQLAADFGSAPLVVVIALTGLPAAALNAALPDSRQPLLKSAERSHYLGSTEPRRHARGAAPVGVTGTRPGCCVTTTTPCVDGTAAGGQPDHAQSR
jgi:hypothetical protein